MSPELLKEIPEEYPEARTECIAVVTRRLAEFEVNDPTLNGFLILALLHMKAVESANIIQEAYANDCVDKFVCGDWNEAQYELGLKVRPPSKARPSIFPTLSTPVRSTPTPTPSTPNIPNTPIHKSTKKSPLTKKAQIKMAKRAEPQEEMMLKGNLPMTFDIHQKIFDADSMPLKRVAQEYQPTFRSYFWEMASEGGLHCRDGHKLCIAKPPKKAIQIQTAESGYQDELLDLFRQSPERRKLWDEGINGGWPRIMLDLAQTYLSVTPPKMSAKDLRKILFDLIPLKITAFAEQAPEVIRELQGFWQFLQREFDLPNATCTSSQSPMTVRSTHLAANARSIKRAASRACSSTSDVTRKPLTSGTFTSNSSNCSIRSVIQAERASGQRMPIFSTQVTDRQAAHSYLYRIFPLLTFFALLVFVRTSEKRQSRLRPILLK